MSIRVFVAFLLSVLLAEPAAAQILPIPPGWQMQRAVLLSRHGVRSPEKPNSELDQYVATPWPAWPVPPVRPVRSARCGGVRRRDGWAVAQRIQLMCWLFAGLINVAIWAAVSVGTGAAVYPWWVWVVGPWGVVLLLEQLISKVARRH